MYEHICFTIDTLSFKFNKKKKKMYLNIINLKTNLCSLQ